MGSLEINIVQVAHLAAELQRSIHKHLNLFYSFEKHLHLSQLFHMSKGEQFWENSTEQHQQHGQHRYCGHH